MKTVLISVLLLAAICVPIVVLTKRALMPNLAELARIDELVKETAPLSTVKRLSSPYKIDLYGKTKSGYFTYSVSDGHTDKRVRVDWQIERGIARLLSVNVQE